jgi:hypothetical protein
MNPTATGRCRDNQVHVALSSPSPAGLDRQWNARNQINVSKKLLAVQWCAQGRINNGVDNDYKSRVISSGHVSDNLLIEIQFL